LDLKTGSRLAEGKDLLGIRKPVRRQWVEIYLPGLEDPNEILRVDIISARTQKWAKTSLPLAKRKRVIPIQT